MASNKRKHQRVRAKGVAANVRSSSVMASGCLVENISIGGLLARTDHPLEVGTQVQMDLMRPGSRSALTLSGFVIARAEPASNEPYAPVGMRIRFDPMTETAAERLRGLLAELGLPQDAVEVPDRRPKVPASPVSALPGGDSPVMVQVRKLLVELGEAQGKLSHKDRQAEELSTRVERLQADNRELRERLARAEELLKELRRKN